MCVYFDVSVFLPAFCAAESQTAEALEVIYDDVPCEDLISPDEG